MITKNYLFHCSNNKNVSPNIFSVMEKIHQAYSYHLIISKKNMDQENYVFKCSMCRKLLGLQLFFPTMC